VDLAHWYYEHGKEEEAAGVAVRALSITERAYDYLTEARAWDNAALRRLAGWVPEQGEQEEKT
jgi:hypothetical protein